MKNYEEKNVRKKIEAYIRVCCLHSTAEVAALEKIYTGETTRNVSCVCWVVVVGSRRGRVRQQSLPQSVISVYERRRNRREKK